MFHEPPRNERCGQHVEPRHADPEEHPQQEIEMPQSIDGCREEIAGPRHGGTEGEDPPDAIAVADGAGPKAQDSPEEQV
jgi:hypothetical protein